jgi:hypothetical protein
MSDDLDDDFNHSNDDAEGGDIIEVTRIRRRRRHLSQQEIS